MTTEAIVGTPSVVGFGMGSHDYNGALLNVVD